MQKVRFLAGAAVTDSRELMESRCECLAVGTAFEGLHSLRVFGYTPQPSIFGRDQRDLTINARDLVSKIYLQ